MQFVGVVRKLRVPDKTIGENCPQDFTNEARVTCIDNLPSQQAGKQPRESDDSNSTLPGNCQLGKFAMRGGWRSLLQLCSEQVRGLPSIHCCACIKARAPQQRNAYAPGGLGEACDARSHHAVGIRNPGTGKRCKRHALQRWGRPGQVESCILNVR